MSKKINKKEIKRPTRYHARTYLLFIFFALLFLFYPGSSYYVDLFFYNRDFFANADEGVLYDVSPVAYVKYPYIKPDISAKGVYVVDLESFSPVFARNENKRFFPASTAKIISAFVAAEAYDLSDVLTVRRIVDEGQVMELVEDEKITVENLLYGLLVHSANDAAYVLADNHPQGYGAFISAMNEKATDLKMINSKFENPAGLDEDAQHVSPFDLALASRALLEEEVLAKMVSIKSITVSDVDFKHFHELRNVNKLLGKIEGVGGLKTGYTLDAGENLITFYKKNGAQFLIVLLKSEDRFEDTEKIVEWIDVNVSYIIL